MYKYLILLVILNLPFRINAQEDTIDHYLIEWEKFEPPIKEMISSFEGFPAEQFMASDIKGEELFLGDFQGKKIILWFWSIEDEQSLSLVPLLNNYTQQSGEKLGIVSFANENSAVLKENESCQNANFHIIPNGSVFGEAVYGSELGIGRMFLIDDYGIIKKVVPRDAIFDKEKLKNIIDKTLNLTDQ